MGDAYKARAERFRTLLEPLSETESDACSAVIDVARVRSMCFYGIPDEGGFRPRAWKFLLGYLPPDKRAWKASLQQSRENYYSFIRDLISNMPETLNAPAANSEGEITGMWADYQAENVTLEQIDKDVRRTLPEIDFFQRTVTPTPLSPLSTPLESSVFSGEELSEGKPRIVPEAEDEESAAESVAEGAAETGSSTPSTIGVGVGPRESQTGSPAGDRPKRPTANVLGLTLGVPHPTYARVPDRRNLFRRIARIHPDSGTRKHQEEILVPGRGGQAADARSPNSASPGPALVVTSWSASGANGANAGGSAVCSQLRDSSDTDFHWEAVERILYLYAKLNPGVGYVQGMNELLAPIYFCLANDREDDGRAHAEADSFHVFTVLMSRCRNSFLRSLDTDKNLGIGALMRRVDDIVRSSDPELWQRLADQSVVPEYYSFRWLTTLCAREFELPGVLRLWDSVLADHEFLTAFCAAMVLCLRDEILAADYAQCIQLLQNYPVKDDISPLLAKAYELHEGRPRCERGEQPALGKGEGQKDAPPVRSNFTWGSRRRDGAEGVGPERKSKRSPLLVDKGDRNGKLMTRFQKWMPSIMSPAGAAVEPSHKLRQIGLPGGVRQT